MEDIQKLVERSKQKDKKAFAALYECVYKDLYKFAYYSLRSPEDAEDAVSETIADAYETIDKLRSAEAFKSWIFRILSNKCKQKMRNYYNQTSSLNETDSSYEHDLAQKNDIKAAISKLSDEEKLIVSLSVFGGYKGEEIGRLLDIKHSTIRSKYRRALEKLKNYIEMEANI